MIFRQAEKEYWYELRIMPGDWNRPEKGCGKKFIKKLKEQVPAQQRRFIKRKDCWLIHQKAKHIVDGLIGEIWGGQRGLFDEE